LRVRVALRVNLAVEFPDTQPAAFAEPQRFCINAISSTSARARKRIG